MIIISIITVVKNNLSGLKSTYESIKIQTLNQNKFEWIVKDSESNDGTKEFLKQIESDKVFVNFKWRSNIDTGIYDGMNQGIEMAKGNFLNFQNGGDVFADSNVLEKIDDTILPIEVACYPTFIYGNDIMQNSDSHLVQRKARDIQYLWHSLPCSHQAVFYNRDHIRNIKYDLKYKICGDYKFTYDIYLNNYKSHIILDIPITIMAPGYHSIYHKHELLNEAFKIKKEIGKTGFKKYISYLIGYWNNTALYKYPKAYILIRKVFDKLINPPQNSK